MKRGHVILAGLAISVAPSLFASGPVGIYGIVEKVVFEPNEQTPERIQIWGAFAFHDDSAQASTIAKRGYLYFAFPESATDSMKQTIRREWADLKSVAGTGQAVAFGRWGYIGALEGLQSDQRVATTGMPPYILSPDPGRPRNDVRVRPETETGNPPAVYVTDAGIVKLSPDGSNAAIVKALRDALKK